MTPDKRFMFQLGGEAQLKSEFLESASSDELFRKVSAEFTFEERAIVLFGKRLLQPRLISWAGDHPYTYSRDTLPPRPWPGEVSLLRDAINNALAELEPNAPPFNHVLANLYRDGTDSMGLHSDDEPELGEDPWIASLSLGAARCFQIVPKQKFRRKGQPLEKVTLTLPSGSLLLMKPPMQRYYLHGLTKTKRLVGPRLNLTFRSIRCV